MSIANTFSRLGLLSLVVLLFGCQHDNPNANRHRCNALVLFGHENGRLKKGTFDSITCKLKMETFLTNDSVPNGAEKEYYYNGQLKKWKWFNAFSANNRYPVAAIYYDTAGRYLNYRGTPFIRAGRGPENKMGVEMIKPPNVRFGLVYIDKYRGEVVRRITYEPGLTDSTCWVVLDAYKHAKGHIYTLCFNFLDSQNRVIDSSLTQLTE
jgi:hypothetical protein